MTAADLDFIAAMLAHPEVMHFWPRCYSRDEAGEWIERQQERYARHGHGYWLALDKASGTPVGQAGIITQDVDGRPQVGLGWIIHRPFWRQGFAAEAGAAWRDRAFQQLGLERVIALIRPENVPSQGLARKLGMVVEGRTLNAGFEHLIFAARRPAPGAKATALL
jgi:RimJ/RimL family protein N-acetyltransferase